VAPWLALAPVFFLLGRRRPALLGFCHGLGFWLASIAWVAHTVRVYGGAPPGVGALVLLLLAAYLSLFHLAFGALGARIWAAGGVLGVTGTAALWVALEWLRGVALTGFPWNLSAYAWEEVPGALALSSWIGAWGVSLAVALANAGWARTLERRRVGPAAAATLGVLLVLAWAARWAKPPAVEVGAAARLPVAVVQPNTPVRADSEHAVSDYTRLRELSRLHCDRPRLLIWPESATYPYVYGRHEFLRADTAALAAAGCPVLLNTVSSVGQRAFNSVLLVTGEGEPERYDKRHLVPFGEYVPAPFRVLPFVERLARAAGDFSAGDDVRLLDWRGERLAVSICFEVTFPGEVAEAVRAGAGVLVTVSNDAWFGASAAARQHFRSARFRAAENRRPLARAAITGVSGLIDADGALIDRLGEGEVGALEARLRPNHELSPYTRRPWLVPVAVWLVAAFAILRSARRAR